MLPAPRFIQTRKHEPVSITCMGRCDSASMHSHGPCTGRLRGASAGVDATLCWEMYAPKSYLKRKITIEKKSPSICDKLYISYMHVGCAECACTKCVYMCLHKFCAVSECVYKRICNICEDVPITTGYKNNDLEIFCFASFVVSERLDINNINKSLGLGRI